MAADSADAFLYCPAVFLFNAGVSVPVKMP